MHTQSLSFGVRIARTRNELQAACRVRAMSYGHHVPQLHSTLMEPDLLDADANTVVVLCVDKLSGEAVGTARFQTNAGDPLVKLCLMKASYLFCLATQVRWMVIGARSEALVRQYRRLGFSDLFEDGRFIPLLHAGRLDHRVLSFNVTTAESRWRETRHPLYEFMIETSHPDIQLFSTQPALPRRDPVRRIEQPTGWLATGRGQPAEAMGRQGSSRPVLVN